MATIESSKLEGRIMARTLKRTHQHTDVSAGEKAVERLDTYTQNEHRSAITDGRARNRERREAKAARVKAAMARLAETA